MNKYVWFWLLVIGMAVSVGHAADAVQPSSEPYAGNRLDAEHGRQIYDAVCASCHDSGQENAPRLQEPAAWKQRSLHAFTVMNNHAKSGFLHMPAKGRQAELTPEEIADAVFYMTQTLQEK